MRLAPCTIARVPFLQVHLTLGAIDPERAEATCFDAGAQAVMLADAGDSPILEPAPGATPLWPSVAMTALFDAAADQDALADALRASLGEPALPLRFEILEDRPWEREWLKDFHPMRFGRRLWICPGGQSPPSAETVDEPPVIVWLDPGLAFGTGTHATTALCLEYLDGAPLTGAQVLDVGTGSGILAIAALRLGAARARAVDIDPQALTASRENALRNDIGEALEVAPAADPWGQGYDLALANILAEPLIQLAPALTAATRIGGTLVLSGLLAEQAGAVTEAYAACFDMAPARERAGWAGLVGQRRR